MEELFVGDMNLYLKKIALIGLCYNSAYHLFLTFLTENICGVISAMPKNIFFIEIEQSNNKKLVLKSNIHFNIYTYFK